jgi:XapX domain-containing protein
MLTALLALATGLAFGIATKLLGLPLPAPNAFAGVLCIAGVYFGALLVGAIK